MTTEPGQWIEELFPPAFGLTINDILKSKPPGGREENHDTTDVFEKVAKCQVSPLDVSAIKNVYQRVWLVTVLQEEEGRIKVKEAAEKEKAELLSAEVKGHDSCIWSAEELKVLREVFNAAKKENVQLRAELQITNEELAELCTANKTQSKMVHATSKNLGKAKKSNERQRLLIENLKSQLDEANARIRFLEGDVARLEKEHSQNMAEMHDLRACANKERLDKAKLEIDTATLHADLEQEMLLREENLKSAHTHDLEYMQNLVDELTRELEKEKLDHQRTRKGLEHLRNHFSSLPLSGEGAPPGAVLQNQLKKWTI